MFFKFRYLPIIAFTLLIQQISAETKIAGILNSDAEWFKNKSPYIVVDDLVIPEGIALTIEPGTEIHFRKSVAMIVKGDLFAAGEKGNEIVFKAENVEEPWGGIRIMDTGSSYGEYLKPDVELKKGEKEVIKYAGKPKSYTSKMEYTQGSFISNCVFENAGMHKRPSNEAQSKVGGALVCYNTAPYIENCTFRNNSFTKGGALSALYYASPLIKDCIFYNNKSEQGGAAIYCFFFAAPIITGNLIKDNESGESGGAILVNSSKPEIKDNLLFRNKSLDNGGGIAVVTSETTIYNNQFRDNKAENIGSGVYMVASKINLNDNLFLNDGFYDVTAGRADSAVYTSNCYWGQSLTSYATSRIYDLTDNLASGEVILQSIAKFPSPKLPFSPINIRNMKITGIGNDNYTKINSPLYIQTEASGGYPDYKDIITVLITSSQSDTDGLRIQLTETDRATNIYRGVIVVKSATDLENNYIAAKSGETITLTVDQNPKEVQTVKVK